MMCSARVDDTGDLLAGRHGEDSPLSFSREAVAPKHICAAVEDVLGIVLDFVVVVQHQ